MVIQQAGVLISGVYLGVQLMLSRQHFSGLKWFVVYLIIVNLFFSVLCIGTGLV